MAKDCLVFFFPPMSSYTKYPDCTKQFYTGWLISKSTHSVTGGANIKNPQSLTPNPLSFTLHQDAFTLMCPPLMVIGGIWKDT